MPLMLLTEQNLNINHVLCGWAASKFCIARHIFSSSHSTALSSLTSHCFGCQCPGATDTKRVSARKTAAVCISNSLQTQIRAEGICIFFQWHGRKKKAPTRNCSQHGLSWIILRKWHVAVEFFQCLIFEIVLSGSIASEGRQKKKKRNHTRDKMDKKHYR